MIAERLAVGEGNAKTGKELCLALGINSRELTQIVESERRAGKPICASCNGKSPGYYLAANKEEMQRYCKALFHRAGEIHKTRRACLGTIEELPD